MADDEDDIAEASDAVEGDRKAKPSKTWLTLISDHDKAGYQDYQDRCTNIEKQYADLSRLAAISRSREFQIFWANIEVLKPSMYARPPVPVVTTRFKDRRPIPRAASELLERSATVGFEREDIDYVMRQARDDLAILARGCLWVRYEAKSKDNDLTERCCIEFKNRRDFVHDPARQWQEVDWVAGGSWMTRKEMRKRFSKTSGKAYQDANFSRRKDARGNIEGQSKARVWEIWSKSQNKVIWVSPGVDVILDEDEPHLKLEGFFPCPRPAYGTLQRNSLIPVPDFLFYKDQVEEINDLTNRLSALTDALRVRGFYPAGAGEIGDAIETALKSLNDRQVMIPISNWAAFGGGAAKDTIVWLPLDMIATTITQIIQLRRQLIEDVYQISGLSDVMRGATNPNETLGAQTLKTQYGSVRIRDRQNELVRLARDTARIMAEIMAENFQKKTLLDMSQMEFQTDAEVAKAVKATEQQAKAIADELTRAQGDPEVIAMAQQNPEAAQKIMDQAQAQVQQLMAQIEGLKDTVTIEKVMDFLRDQKIRPFVLDIETDSTIQPDEDAAKQRSSEFLGALGNAMAQLGPMIQTRPETAGFAGEILKFAVGPFRAGRTMDGAIDEFVEKLTASSGAPQPDPNAGKMEAEAKASADRAAIEKAKAEAIIAKSQADTAAVQTKAQADAELSRTKAQADVARLNAEAVQSQQEHALKMQESATRAASEKAKADAAITKLQADAEIARVKAEADIAKTNAEAARRQQDHEAKMQEAAAKMASLQADAMAAAQKHAQDMQKGELELAKLRLQPAGQAQKNMAEATAPVIVEEMI